MRSNEYVAAVLGNSVLVRDSYSVYVKILNILEHPKNVSKL